MTWIILLVFWGVLHKVIYTQLTDERTGSSSLKSLLQYSPLTQRGRV